MGYQAKVVTGGKLVLPAALRRDLGIRDGDTVVIERDGDGLRVSSRDAVLREIQTAMRATAENGASVDDFLAWRRRDNGDG